MSIPESRVSRDSPFESLRANGKPKGSCLDKLSRTEKVNDFNINSVHPEPVEGCF